MAHQHPGNLFKNPTGLRPGRTTPVSYADRTPRYRHPPYGGRTLPEPGKNRLRPRPSGLAYNTHPVYNTPAGRTGKPPRRKRRTMTTNEPDRPPPPPAEDQPPTDITAVINQAVTRGIAAALTDLVTNDVWETARDYMDGERELRSGIRSIVRNRLREWSGSVRIELPPEPPTGDPPPVAGFGGGRTQR